MVQNSRVEADISHEVRAVSARSADHNSQEATPEKNEDNKLVAVIAMIFAAVSVTGMTCMYRTIAVEGFAASDFNLVRNMYSFVIACIWLIVTGNKPVVEFPFDKECPLMWRILMGQTTFLLMNMAAPLAPISLIMICFITSPFWTSIVARLVLEVPNMPNWFIFSWILVSVILLLTMYAMYEEVDAEHDTWQR